MKNPELVYQELLNLCRRNQSFELKEIVIDGHIYHIFNYRIASWSDFQEPSAIEARGIMFLVDENRNFIRLVCRPLMKFFNFMENPDTTGLDLSKTALIYDKADGTMLATYMHKGEMRFKTRKMLETKQISDAEEYLRSHRYLYTLLYDLTHIGLTVICEWVAPDNRIVLEYKEPKLIVLAIRGLFNGEEASIEMFRGNPILEDYLAKKIQPVDDLKLFLENKLPTLEDIEGCVAIMEDGKRVKFKTDWYQLRHGTIDIILTPKRLFEALLDEKYDELISINSEIPYLIEKIKKMFQIVRRELNELTSKVDQFYQANRGLDRKSYAILGQGSLDSRTFGLAMSKYLGREIDYKKAMVNLWHDSISKKFEEREYMQSE